MTKKIVILIVIAICALLLSSLVLDTYLTYNQNKTLKTDFNVGVMYCGSTTEGAKLMIDRVKGYTNLFLQSNSQIVYNQTQLEEVCEYAVDAGLNFIVNLGTASSINYENSTWGPLKWTWQFDWLDMAKERWGNKFVGVYYYDEPGGIHIDANWDQSSGDYYNTSLFYQWVISSEAGLTALREKNITIFTSDYALYWFDYLAGFDVVLGEQCPNASGVQTVDMVRGAADMQGKDWGITITWSDPTPPYLGSPQEMYQQMLTAYQAGAKYVLIFDYPTYPEDNPYGLLTDDHFTALEQFWNDITSMPPETYGSIKAEAALVLPTDYGWGMRHPDDKIWGAWGPDEKSPVIWNISRALLEDYGYGLDIIYDDSAYPLGNRYMQVYYWNQTYTG